MSVYVCGGSAGDLPAASSSWQMRILDAPGLWLGRGGGGAEWREDIVRAGSGSLSVEPSFLLPYEHI